ncbi:MAG: methyl-accepting chemotaxis protein [Myxococcota bacterium]
MTEETNTGGTAAQEEAIEIEGSIDTEGAHEASVLVETKASKANSRKRNARRKVRPEVKLETELRDLRAQQEALWRSQSVITFMRNGKILDANPKFLDLMGYQKEEIVGRHHRIFVTEEESRTETYAAFWQRLSCGEHESGIFRRRRKDGSFVFIQSTYFPVVDEDGDVYKVVKTATDVTSSVLSRMRFQSELQRLTQACTEGDLSFRASSRELDDDLRETMETVNHLVDTVAKPILIASDTVGQVAQGARPPKVNQNWPGAFATLERVINALIDSDEHLAQTTQRVANGDLTVTVSPRSDNDALLFSLSNMVNSLTNTLQSVRQTAIDVRSGSTLVASASRDVSDNSTQSAASIEEVSASAERIAKQTGTNAEHASQALALADRARERAEAGDGVMNSMLSAMTDIERMGQDISKIVKVIDEIAFQTNLLALNAAVEAARAGEHGKGFAVVAEEVGRLAARSAKAARETTSIIKETIQKVSGGMELAQQTAHSLTEIVEGVGEARQLVSQIAEATHEQADAIGQINIGLSQVDEVTQRNTAGAGEMAAAASQLASQAGRLTELLDHFHLPAVQPRDPSELTPEMLEAFHQFLAKNGINKPVANNSSSNGEGSSHNSSNGARKPSSNGAWRNGASSLRNLIQPADFGRY